MPRRPIERKKTSGDQFQARAQPRADKRAEYRAKDGAEDGDAEKIWREVVDLGQRLGCAGDNGGVEPEEQAAERGDSSAFDQRTVECHGPAEIVQASGGNARQYLPGCRGPD